MKTVTVKNPTSALVADPIFAGNENLDGAIYIKATATDGGIVVVEAVNKKGEPIVLFGPELGVKIKGGEILAS